MTKLATNFAKVIRLAPQGPEQKLSLELLSAGLSKTIGSDFGFSNATSDFTFSDERRSEALWKDRRWYYSLGLMQASIEAEQSNPSRPLGKSGEWAKYFASLSGNPRIQLPQGARTAITAASAVAASAARRTWRAFTRSHCGIEQLASVLSELTSGIDGLPDFHDVFAAHVIVLGVDGLSTGIYALDPATFSLVLVRAGDFTEQTCKLLRGLLAPKSAAFTLVLSADMAALPDVYHGQLGIREMYVHSGFATQKAIEASTVLGLGTLPTPAIPDTMTAELLGIDGVRQNPVYSLTVGTTDPVGAGAGQ